MIVSNGGRTIAQRAAKLQLRTWLIWVAVAAVTLIVIQVLEHYRLEQCTQACVAHNS